MGESIRKRRKKTDKTKQLSVMRGRRSKALQKNKMDGNIVENRNLKSENDVLTDIWKLECTENENRRLWDL